MVERIGILGGSFNPIHRGHIEMCLRLREYLALNRVLLLPNHNPPHKEGLNLDYAGRVLLIEQAISGMDGLEISDLERDDRSHFTYHTLRTLKHRCHDTELFFAMGMDSLLRLTTWHNGLYLTEFAHLVVFARHGFALSEANPALTTFLQGRTIMFSGPAHLPRPLDPGIELDPGTAQHGTNANRGHVYLIDEYPPEVSATQVRRLLDDYYTLGSSDALSRLYALLGNAVLETILSLGYYRR